MLEVCSRTWKRFLDWLHRPVVKIELFDPHKGMISEGDMDDVLINGKVFAEDPLKTRKLIRYGNNSRVLTINPQFVQILCPLNEKFVNQRLIKQLDGTFLLVVKPVAGVKNSA